MPLAAEHANLIIKLHSSDTGDSWHRSWFVFQTQHRS